MSDSEQKDVLDLYDIALILNYERLTTEPRFRHAKLREVAFPGEKLQTVLLMQDPTVDRLRPCTSLVFDRPPHHQGKIDMDSPPDLPSDMLPDNVENPKLKALTPKQLETIFWQARNHDGCYQSVTLVQHFFDLYEPSTLVRIRHGPRGKNPGKVYTTRIDTRVIFEMTLFNPRVMTISMMLPENKTYLLGEGHTLRHATVGFADDLDGGVESILDLASLQAGDLGRGPGTKGQGLFALETMDEFFDRLETIVEGNDDASSRISKRIGPCPQDQWLKQVAKRAKERWDKRDTEKWCGHCGAPRALTDKKCGGCRDAWYCDEMHQKLAWPYHKHYCAEK